jgi:hypothetical protein
MAKYVIRSEHLLDYFDKVRKVSGRYDAVLGDFVPERHPPLGHGGLEGNAEVSWCHFPLPSVPLIRFTRLTLSGPLSVETKRVGNTEQHVTEIARQISPSNSEPPNPMGPTNCIDAKLKVHTDLSFVIGPSRLLKKPLATGLRA